MQGPNVSPAVRWTQVLGSAIVLYGLWLVLSGHYTPFLLGVGLAATAFSVYIAVRMELVDHEGFPSLNLTARLLTYIPWLIYEIVITNIAAVKIILSPSLPIRPVILRFTGQQKTDVGRVIFANSITLTPGTITMAVIGDEFVIHALDADAVGDMEEAEMNRRVASLEHAVRTA